ncbi:MAG TPA: hypothetical protein VIK84_04415 [Haloplasmataceae bacterium]
MSNNKKLVSLITLIFIILAGIAVYLIVYSFDYRLTPFSKGTEVSNIYIGGKTEQQTEEELMKRVNEWKRAERIIEVSYQNQSYTVEIDPNIFSFDIPNTIDSIQNGKKADYEKNINILKVTIVSGKENHINDKLNEILALVNYKDFDLEKVKSYILKKVTFLAKEIYVDLSMAINLDSAKLNKIQTVKSSLTGYQRYNDFNTLISRYFSEPIEIKAKSEFSLNQYILAAYKTYAQNNVIPKIDIKDYHKIFQYYFNEEELNRIATGIFESIIKTNFIVERVHISKSLPSYAQLGKEAALDIELNPIVEGGKITDVEFLGIKDLIFYNPNGHSYFLKIIVNNNQLEFQLYGPDFIYSFNENIIIEEILDEIDGQLLTGYFFKLERISYLRGNMVEKRTLMEDFYQPYYLSM